MGAVESLAAWGIVRPAEVVELAAATRLPLALAASLLEQESAGGHNVWGSDRVDTGGAYVKGAEVTRAAYAQYRDLVQAKKIGRNGVGPTQLTAAAFQDAADRLGGCWDWRCNVKVGFDALGSLVQRYGLPDGIRRYNGSGPAAEAYRDHLLARYQRWTDRLGSAPMPPVPTPAPTPVEDEPMAPIPLTVSNGMFRATVMAETGATSAVVERSWISLGSTWGDTHFRLTALGDRRDVLLVRDADVPNNGRASFELPPGTVMATVEGHVASPAVVPAAALVCQLK